MFKGITKGFVNVIAKIPFPRNPTLTFSQGKAAPFSQEKVFQKLSKCRL